MRVALLSQWLAPGGGGFVGGIAQALSEMGADVSIFTGDQSYGGLKIPIKVHQRQGFIGRRADVSHSSVVRYPTYVSHDESAVRRLLTYASFSIVGLDALPSLRSADVVLAYCSPATAALPGVLSKHLGGPPLVLMIQDVWPDSVTASGFITRSLLRTLTESALRAYMEHLYSHATAVTALSPGMRQLLIERGTDPRRTYVVYNWADEVAAERVVPMRRTDREPLHLMYSGNMGPGQNLSNVLQAFVQLPEDRVRLSLVGDGAELSRLRRMVESLRLSNVRFISRVPRERMPEILSSAHLHLVSLADEDVYRTTLPSKFQSLIAAGLPVLIAAPGEVAAITEASHAGFTAPPDNPRELSNVIRNAIMTPGDVLIEMGRRGRELYQKEMSRDTNLAKLYRVLEASAQGTSSSESVLHYSP